MFDFCWLEYISIIYHNNKVNVPRNKQASSIELMSPFFISTSRAIPTVLFRQRCLLLTPRLLSSGQYNNDILQAQKQQLKVEPPPPTPKQSPRLRRYHYYVLSIATGALIGTIYALRQVRKHEGGLPEYVANAELLERKAMETRPLPPPVTKHITFDAPPRQNFSFNLTLYQYVTWFVSFTKS
jgi:hypothetical protein